MFAKEEERLGGDRYIKTRRAGLPWRSVVKIVLLMHRGTGFDSRSRN